MSAAGSGVRPDGSGPADTPAPDDDPVPGPPTPPGAAGGRAGGLTASRWKPSDWDGLLARPPGLPEPAANGAPAAGPAGPEGVHGGLSGTGWPAGNGFTSVLVAGAQPVAWWTDTVTDQAGWRTIDPAIPKEASPGAAVPAVESLAAPPESAATLAGPPVPHTREPTAPVPAVPVLPADRASQQPPTSPLPRPGRAWMDVPSWSLQRLLTVAATVLLLTVLSAYFVSALQPTVYAAEADVLFSVTGSSQEGERQLATQEVLLSSRGVLSPVAERFDVPLPELTRSQDVEQLAGSQVLRTRIRNNEPELAVRLAQGVAESYVASVSTGVTDLGAEQERRLRDEITDLSVRAAAGRARLDEIAAARAGAAASPGGLAVTAEERNLQVEDTALTQRVSALQSELTQILVQRETATPAEILTPAYLLDQPVGPRPVRAAAAGAMLGLVLSSGLLALGLRRRLAGLP